MTSQNPLLPVLLAGLLAGAAGPALADFDLTILHLNDLHSRIEPVNDYDSACSEEDVAENSCFGGVARLATAIAERQASSPQTLVLDAGDQFQGSLFYTHYKGADAAEFTNRLGIEAMAVGNHEFDDGPAVLRRFVEAVDFPVVMANADMADEPALAALVRPSTVIEKGGERIGIIGLTPQDNNELTQAGKTIRFSDPVEAARAEVARLEADGVTRIILLSHSGYEADKRIAAAVDGIDVIVGGHSHTLLSNTDEDAAGPYPTMVDAPDGTGVPIVQAYSYGKYLGELRVTWNDEGVVTAADGAPILLDDAFAEEPRVKARIAELAEPLEEIRTRVVARTESPIDGSRETCRAGECQMGVLVAEAMLERVRDQGVTVAITNGGGLRASIDAGEITMGEVLTVLPFQNTLATFQLTGADIRAALESGVSQVEEGAGRFPQVAGLQFDWAPAGTAGEDRIREIRVREGDAWTPIDPAKTYTLVSNNFMRNGGDGYAVFAERAENPYDFGPNMEEAVIAFLTRGNEAYRPATDGRIREVE